MHAYISLAHGMLCSGIRCVCVCTMQLCVFVRWTVCISFIISVCLSLSLSLCHSLATRSRFVILLFICSLAFCFVIVIQYCDSSFCCHTPTTLWLWFCEDERFLYGISHEQTIDRSVGRWKNANHRLMDKQRLV